MDIQYVSFSEKDKSIFFKRGHTAIANMISKDKAEMAWRHRSRQEKLLLRVIAFLSFVLAAFIIAVIAMDLAYKSEIRKLEDEVQAMKTTPAIVTSTEVISTLATSSSTSSRNATSSTESFTTPPEEDTTTPLTETPSDDEITAEEVTTPSQEGNPAKLVSADGLVEALRALMTSFSKGSESSSAKGPEYRTDTRRTKGTFILLADLLHEEIPSQGLHGEEDTVKKSKETVEIMKLKNPENATSAAANQSENTAWTESPPISTLPSITHENPRVSPQVLPSPTLPANLDPTVSHSIDSADEEYRRFGTSSPTEASTS